MYPHERSLVKALAGQPFVILGVNSDQDRTEIKETVKKEEITWRSFWCGEDGTSGEIPSAWRVQGWPTLYLIDHKGIIRHKFVGSPGDKKLDELIEELVKEAEKDKN